jgi:ATP-dependent Clp protease ATP-binding subunit ClpC
VEKHVGSHPETNIIGNIPYTPRVKKVLVLAGKEAKALHHSYVGTEHILLGLVRDKISWPVRGANQGRDG